MILHQRMRPFFLFERYAHIDVSLTAMYQDGLPIRLQIQPAMETNHPCMMIGGVS